MRGSSNRSHVGTLGSLLRGGRELWLNCESCRHRQQMDLMALIAVHGEGLRVQELVERARCSKCGARHVTVTAPPDLGSKGKFSYPRHDASPPTPTKRQARPVE